uniref:Enhancer of polycomb-like protein n=1 Tax=Enterobius vermicularis TaxID=51028 RepID=A0A0N4UXV2_ENTVE
LGFQESHLQEAILAQQACTSGIKVENHVIPTPKVILLEDDYYKQLYPSQPLLFKNRLIKVQGSLNRYRFIASLSVEREQPEYDADSEDEQWLAGKEIPINDFEKMMELLESASSDLQICQPREAQSLLKEFDDNLVDDVYDYWLQKRKVAAAIRKTASLIARIKTDSRRDTPGTVNPYVAFRRRAEKMQTRKNRKNDEESYEKILKLGYDMGKALSLFEMMKKREKTKAALIALDEKIFVERRMSSLSVTTNGDTNVKTKPEFYVSFEDIQDENAGSIVKTKSQKRKKHGWSATVSAVDKDVVTRAWLKKNAEAWNKPPVGITWLTTGCSTSAVTASEAERSAADAEAAADGRFAFKRRRGCIYRASLPVPTLSSDAQINGFGSY